MTALRRPAWVVILALVAVTLVVWLAWISSEIRNELRAKTTETRMLLLMRVLEAEKPTRLDADSLLPLLPKTYGSESLIDAWGHPLLIQSSSHDGRIKKYKIISVGRDGRRGGCCRKWVADWDDDAVLLGNEWLQVWHPKAARASTKEPSASE